MFTFENVLALFIVHTPLFVWILTISSYKLNTSVLLTYKWIQNVLVHCTMFWYRYCTMLWYKYKQHNWFTLILIWNFGLNTSLLLALTWKWNKTFWYIAQCYGISRSNLADSPSFCFGILDWTHLYYLLTNGQKRFGILHNAMVYVSRSKPTT